MKFRNNRRSMEYDLSEPKDEASFRPFEEVKDE